MECNRFCFGHQSELFEIRPPGIQFARINSGRFQQSSPNISNGANIILRIANKTSRMHGDVGVPLPELVELRQSNRVSGITHYKLGCMWRPHSLNQFAYA